GTLAGMIRGYAPASEFSKMIGETEAKYKDFLKRAADEDSIAKDYPKRLDLAREYRARYLLPESEARFTKLTTEFGVPVKVRDEAFYDLAMTQLIGRKYDASLKTIKKFGAIQSKGEPYEKARLLAADIYMAQGQYQQAVNEFRAFKATFPK